MSVTDRALNRFLLLEMRSKLGTRYLAGGEDLDDISVFEDGPCLSWDSSLFLPSSKVLWFIFFLKICNYDLSFSSL